MPTRKPGPAGVALLLATLVAAGCGGSSKTTPSGSAAGGGTALAADAKSAATGDIPDNQNFLTFTDARARFSMRYPEGWARSGSAGHVSFQDKNNLVRVTVGSGPAPSVASMGAELAKLRAAAPTLRSAVPRALTLRGKRLIKVTYTTESAPNQVTGRRVTLVVDRYELAHRGRVATVELGTPKGVDNVDAYRMMIESFTWR